MATQGFKVNFSAFTEQVILTWYLHSAPAAEVGRVLHPFPNVSGEVVEASGLIGETYIFKFWRSVDGVALSELIESWSVDVAKGTKSRIEFFYYTVGGPGAYDPAPNQETLTDPRLKDQVFYVSSRGTSWWDPTEYTEDPDGGFSLTGGQQFSYEDKWTVMVVYSDDLATPSITEDNSDIHIVDADGPFDESYRGVENIADFPAGSTGVTSFPDFGSITNGRVLFSTFHTQGRYWRLQFAAGNTVRHLGQDANQITLRRNERLELFFKNGACYVTDYRGDAELAGEVVLADKKLINTEYADGSEKDVSDYQDLINRLPVEKVVSYTDWDAYQDVKVGEVTKRYYHNRGKFAVDAISGKFKFPDLRGQSFRALKDVNGANDITMLSQGAGGMWAQEIISHKHPVPGKASGASGGGALTDGSNDGQGTKPDTEAVGGSEQRVDSTAQYALIRI